MTARVVVFTDVDEPENPPPQVMELQIVGAGNGIEATAWFEVSHYEEHHYGHAVSMVSRFGINLADLRTALDLLDEDAP